jgi:putative ubiquitin-RnfH superfamily antitoxin RatB of RatAB toxin-antitoxin module
MSHAVELRWLDPQAGIQLQKLDLPSATCELQVAIASWIRPESPLSPSARKLLELYGLMGLGINGKRAKPHALISAVDRIDLMPPVSAEAMELRRSRASLYKTRRRSSAR